MKISYNWLKDYIQINKSPEDVCKLLTSSGLEVEDLQKVEALPGGLEGLVIGEVITCEKHPGADKLSKTTVDIGENEPSPIICGAPNVAAGQKVIVATVGSTLFPIGGEPFKIKKAKIRGEVSLGMICAEDEIGLGNNHDGIMVLSTKLPNGTPAIEYFDFQDDYVIEIGLTPNRVDAASHFGVARDLKALTGRKTVFPDISRFQVSNNSRSVQIIVENQEACPRYAGLTVSNLTIKESPDWLQDRLKVIGLAPINNVVDITNYVLHSLGQPLHAFDLSEVKGNKVIIKTLPDGTKFTTLDKVERELKSTDLMICNEEEGMCIAGVFGGDKSGVKDTTTEIFLESAYFSSNYVRKTSMVHGLKTDAAFRFERGTDPEGVVFALKWAAILIQELAGGVITSEITDIYPSIIPSFKTQMKYKNIDRLIGKVLGPEKIKQILTGLEIGVENETDEGFEAIIPAYRVDVQREADVIEEILRIYGYDNIELSENLGAESLAHFPPKDNDVLKQRASQTLSGNGFYEIMSNSIISSKYSNESEIWKQEDDVVILNKLSEDLDVMRQTLVFSGLEAIVYNINRKQRNLRLFEFGSVYAVNDQGFSEEKRLGIFATGDIGEPNWREQNATIDYFGLASTTIQLLGRFGFKNLKGTPTENKEFEYGLDYLSNGKKLASVGLLKPSLLKKVDLSTSVFYSDIDWQLLVSLYSPKISYSEIPKFPEVKRDLSVILNKSVKFSEIEKITQKIGRDLIKKVNVFSVYEGDNLGEGKKSYAISYILQDANKTLNDKQIDKVMNQLIRVYEEELGAIIRK